MGHFNEHANQTSKVVGFNYPPERTVRCGAHIIFPFYRKFSVFDLFEGAQILVLRPDGSQRKAENVKNPIAFIAAADWSRLLRGKRQTRNIYKGSQVTLPPPQTIFSPNTLNRPVIEGGKDSFNHIHGTFSSALICALDPTL